MDIDLTLKNYRCFAESCPARISIRPGFTALVGPNNSGKSALLRFLYEFRDLFARIATNNREFQKSLTTGPATFSFPSSVQDLHEVFTNSTRGDLTIELSLRDERTVNQTIRPALVLQLAVLRGQNTFTARVGYSSTEPIDVEKGVQFKGHLLINSPGAAPVDMSLVREACRSLSSSLYIPAYRNAINVGRNEKYFDIDTGVAFIEAWSEWQAGAQKWKSEATERISEEIKRILGFERFRLSLLMIGKPFGSRLTDGPVASMRWGRVSPN